jgi:hypothetical protein
LCGGGIDPQSVSQPHVNPMGPLNRHARMFFASPPIPLASHAPSETRKRVLYRRQKPGIKRARIKVSHSALCIHLFFFLVLLIPYLYLFRMLTPSLLVLVIALSVGISAQSDAAQSNADKVAALRLAQTEVDRIKLLQDNEVSSTPQLLPSDISYAVL